MFMADVKLVLYRPRPVLDIDDDHPLVFTNAGDRIAAKSKLNSGYDLDSISDGDYIPVGDFPNYTFRFVVRVSGLSSGEVVDNVKLHVEDQEPPDFLRLPSEFQDLVRNNTTIKTDITTDLEAYRWGTNYVDKYHIQFSSTNDESGIIGDNSPFTAQAVTAPFHIQGISGRYAGARWFRVGIAPGTTGLPSGVVAGWGPWQETMRFDLPTSVPDMPNLGNFFTPTFAFSTNRDSRQFLLKGEKTQLLKDYIEDYANRYQPTDNKYIFRKNLVLTWDEYTL